MSTLERPVNIVPDSRVKRLRNRIIDAPQEVCVERARYLTRSMSKNWELHPLTRISMALEDILDNITVTIRDDEFIVGCRTKNSKGHPFSRRVNRAGSKGMWMPLIRESISGPS